MSKISIIGLGYVGLPLAIAFSENFVVVGYDINSKRVKDLINGKDVFNDLKVKNLKKNKKLNLTSNLKDIEDLDYYIVTVPTPVNKNNNPDLRSLISASKIVGKSIKKKSIVIFESTVFPSCTEEVCIPIIEKYSGYKLNQDFYCGYSPERINVGDNEHTLEKITKVVSGSNKKTTDKIYNLYKNIIKTKVFKASSIKVAEAAKVIENTQRDLNISLLNELSIIFDRLDIDTNDVIEAAATKWNFIKYKPGLVGGHCVGVDPFYLTYKAKKSGYTPKVILAGRNINEKMSKFIVDKTITLMKQKKINIKTSKILVLGYSFKENCSDPRNSKVEDMIDLILQKKFQLKFLTQLFIKIF